jgi:hypothetical protein
MTRKPVDPEGDICNSRGHRPRKMTPKANDPERVELFADKSSTLSGSVRFGSLSVGYTHGY